MKPPVPQRGRSLGSKLRERTGDGRGTSYWTTVFASREYDAFGTIIPSSSVGTWPGRFGYQGQAWIEINSADAAQRLLLSPTRIYDPSLGRFLQKDPLIRYQLALSTFGNTILRLP